MRLNHLTDEQIQMYLDSIRSSSARSVADVRVERHLAECEFCRESLHDYEELYRAVEACPEPKLSRKFTSRVISRIPDQAALSDSWQSLAVAILSPIAALVTLLLTVDFKALAGKTILTGLYQYTSWKAWADAVASTIKPPPQITFDASLFEPLKALIATHASTCAITLVLFGIVLAFMSLDGLMGRQAFRRL